MAWTQVITPDFQELTLARGQRKRIELTLANAQDIPLRCVLKLTNFRPTIEGYPRPDPEYGRGIETWATLSADSLRLEPGGMQSVLLDLRVPADAAGGYYGLLEAVFHAADTSLEQLRLIDPESGRVPFFPTMAFRSALLVDVKSRDNTAVVEADSLSIDSGRTGRDALGNAGGWRLDLVLRNEGNTHVRCAGSAAIWRGNGTLVGSTPFEAGRGYLFPATRRVFRARGQEPLADGHYVARMTVQLENQGRLQQVSTFHVLDGVAHPGDPDTATAALLRSLLPKFSLAEPFRELRVRPGRDAILTVPLRNVHADTIRLRPVPVAWQVDSLGVNMLDDCVGTDSPCTWFGDLPAELTVPPGRNVTCRFDVNPPSGLGPGEYYCGVLFEDAGETRTPAAARLVRTQLACLVTGEDRTFSVAVDTFAITGRGQDRDIYCRIHNLGQQRAIGTATVRLSRKDPTGSWFQIGDDIDLVSGETPVVMPGLARVYHHLLSGLVDGEYRVALTVHLGGDRSAVNRTVYFAVP